MVNIFRHDGYIFHYSIPALKAGRGIIGFYFDNEEFPQAIHTDSLYGKIIQDNVVYEYTQESLQEWYTKNKAKIAEEHRSVKIQLIKQMMCPNIPICEGIDNNRVMSMKEAKDIVEYWFGDKLEELE